MSSEIVPLTVSPRSSDSGHTPGTVSATCKAAERFFEFFTANIRNKNTRRAYYKAACRFSDWCEGNGLVDLAQVKPLTPWRPTWDRARHVPG
jgi:hypothetical protein